MDTYFKILVPLFTLVTISSKWYRSSSHKKHRWLGFLLQVIPISFWLFYFIATKQCWIARSKTNLDVFGCMDVATAFTASADAEYVQNRIQMRNPDCNVILIHG